MISAVGRKMAKVTLPQHIHVTERHIRDGARKHCGRCPIALAIKDAFPESTSIRVMNYCAAVDDEVFAMPDKASEFIYRFDDGKKVKPFSFWVGL